MHASGRSATTMPVAIVSKCDEDRRLGEQPKQRRIRLLSIGRLFTLQVPTGMIAEAETIQEFPTMSTSQSAAEVLRDTFGFESFRPGQGAVMYSGDLVLGGGWIE